MNRPIRVMSIVCLVLFTALLIGVNYIQFVEADTLNAKNGNRRVIDEEFARERGPILVGDRPIAESVPVDDQWKFQRRYPEAKLYADITGYFSYTFGRSGLEQSQNDILSGSDNRLFVNRVVDLIGSNQPRGGSVSVTINRRAQRAAAEGIENLPGNAKGAVVALDPSTGAILAMTGSPTYNPNLLASHNLDEVSKAWKRLDADKDKPMLNRSTQQILPPGSTFKIVTAAAAMEKLNLNPDSVVKGGRGLTAPGFGSYVLRNQGGGNCGGPRITLTQALEVSCNVTFGDLAMKVGQDDMERQSDAFGFGARDLDQLPMSPSQFSSDPDVELEAPQLAQSGIGQFEVAATPLQMAMATGAIANGGALMKPYLVSTVRSPDLKTIETAKPEKIRDAVSSRTATGLSQMLVDVVENGTGGSAAIPGIEVGGKTGTAQSTADRPPYAWFISFAPADDPKVAVAVVVESSSTGRDDISGGRLAGPIARSVMQAVLDR
ncbi:penicillin-binding protein 2 [Mumia sp. ZJ1417]|uniref:peptidoglycan D,D-transpeptidase FtsI family protein n=1 Tax=Mumia sp. ZJ1417 TaxID=2708082 RepID=UPI00141FF135|nr:penicillin-binding protein 2 [Mumia sp. ZJ1417]QMW66446.1 penicillin-binding protein 2 [Mumia sp. ZJ1417]